MNDKIFVAVLYGGDSSERPVSLASGRQVYESLDRTRYEPVLVDLCADRWQTEDGVVVDKNDFSVSGRRFDYALVVIHGTPGENGVLQGYLDLVGVPYSSCNVAVSVLTMDKSLTKAVVLQRTIDIEVSFAKEIVLARNATIDTKLIVDQLGLPLFVKPNASGSSCGVTKVKREDELHAAIEAAWAEGGDALLEEYIEGTEVSQGVMICGTEQYVLPITELVSHNEFFDYQAKYKGMSEEITPARISASAAARISNATLAIYRTLGCRGVVRVDYIVRDDRPYFIEVNTVPGMSQQSIVPQQWAAVGLTMGEAWDKIIQSTL